MFTKNRVAAWFVSLLMVVGGAIVGLQSPAFAVGVTMAAPTAAPGSPTGYYAVDYAEDKIVVTINSEYLPSGYCMTAYLDIRRATGVGQEGDHYDARAARVCQPYSSRTSSWSYEGANYGIEIVAVNKAGVCYGPINQMGTCQNKVGSVASIDPNFDSNAMCTRSWTKNAWGDNFYFSGGNSADCND